MKTGLKTNIMKEKILESAIDLFYKAGFVKASIRDISQKVGIAKSSVYEHFKSKDDILYQIIIDLNTFVVRELKQAAGMHDSPLESLRAMIFWQVCVTTEKRKEVKIYIEEQYQLPPRLRKSALKGHRQVYKLYYDKICEINQDLLPDMNRIAMAFANFGMINWVYRWFREDGEMTIKEVAEVIIRIFFNGILKDAYLDDNQKKISES
ncbi:MAG: TetR family transcriptional regulator [Deltaproteobacteria bacterium]|nr:TetR family transcriptional regulator [Deltaproteobacteria bacterium]